MSYWVKSEAGELLQGAAAVQAFHKALPPHERQRMLWRLANQSLLSELVLELHAQGFHDMDLGIRRSCGDVELRTAAPAHCCPAFLESHTTVS